MKIIDLTHDIYPGMPCFGAKWHCGTEMIQMGTIDEVGRNTTKLILGSHCGTHIDSPAHFVKNGMTIDRISLNNLVGDVTIVKMNLSNNQAVTSDMLEKINIGEKVIFNFNWANKFNSSDFYSDYPFFSDEACDYLISKGVKLVGMDTPSPDDSRIKLGSAEDSKIHKKFLSNGIILVEYLNNLNIIDDNKGWKLIALPMKLRNCDGAPARVCLIKD